MKETLPNLLRERVVSAEKDLKAQEQELAEIKKLPVLVRNEELVASINYTIGHLNAVIYENKLFLELMEMDDIQFEQYIARKKEIENSNAEMLKRLSSRYKKL